MSAEQSSWKDGRGNHSIAELVSHLIFWNERILITFKGETIPDFNDDNEITFGRFSNDDWNHTINKLDSIQAQWEVLTENASEKQLGAWSTSIANICAHNAYHMGQIIFIRKQNGWWK